MEFPLKVYVLADMAIRLGGGAASKLIRGCVLGLAATLSSVGIAADAGGCAVSMVFTQIGEAIDTRSAKLRNKDL